MDEAKDYGLGGSVLFVTFGESWHTVIFFSWKIRYTALFIYLYLYVYIIYAYNMEILK